MMGFISLYIIYTYTHCWLVKSVLWWRRRRAGNRDSSSSRIQTQGSKEKLRPAVTRDAIQLQPWARTERRTTAAAHILRKNMRRDKVNCSRSNYRCHLMQWPIIGSQLDALPSMINVFCTLVGLHVFCFFSSRTTRWRILSWIILITRGDQSYTHILWMWSHRGLAQPEEQSPGEEGILELLVSILVQDRPQFDFIPVLKIQEPESSISESKQWIQDEGNHCRH